MHKWFKFGEKVLWRDLCDKQGIELYYKQHHYNQEIFCDGYKFFDPLTLTP